MAFVKFKICLSLAFFLVLPSCASLRPDGAPAAVDSSGGVVSKQPFNPANFVCPAGDQSLGEVVGPGDLKVLFCGRRAFKETPEGTFSDLYAWTLNAEQDLNRVVIAERDESVTFSPDPTNPHQWSIRYQVSFPTVDLKGFDWKTLSEKKLICRQEGCLLEKEQCRLDLPQNPFPNLASEVKIPKRPSRRARKKGIIPSKPLLDPLLTRKLLYRSLDGDKFAQRLLSEIHNYFSMDTSMATEAIQNVALFRRAQRIGCARN